MVRKDLSESLGQFTVSRRGLMRILGHDSADDLANDNQSPCDLNIEGVAVRAHLQFGAVSRICVWLFLALTSFIAGAAEPAQSLAGMHHSAWTTRDGAPGTVIAIAQTDDGYLWLASQVGLYRFDGVRFERFNPLPGQPEIDGAVQSLFTPASGGLWVGMYYGGAYFVEGDKVTSYGIHEGLPSRTATRFAQDLDGRIWLASTKGLYRLDGKRFVRQDGAEDAPDPLLLDLLVDREGTVWATGYGPATLAFHRGETNPIRYPTRQGTTNQMLVDRNGAIWVNDETSLMTFSKEGARDVDTRPLVDFGRNDRILLFDSQDTLWMLLNSKLVRITHPSELLKPPSNPMLSIEHMNADDLTSGPSPRTAFEDREGNVWVGSDGGLDRFRPNKLTSIFADNPAVLRPGPTLLAVEGGGVWAGTLGNGLIKIGAKVEFTNFLASEASRKGINRLYRDPSGTIWLAGRGELWHSKDGTFVRDDTPFSVAEAEINAVCMDPEGSLWVAAARGQPWVLKTGHWLAGGGVDGLPTASAIAIESDGKRLWLGYADNRIAWVEKGRARLIGETQGLAVGAVMVIRPQPDVVWIGGQRGLFMYRAGRFRPVTTRTGTKLRGVSGIAQTESGELWLNGADGVTRIPASDVRQLLENPNYSVDTEVLDVRDGLKGTAAQARPLGTALVGTDGRVWFTTMNGVFWIDPAHVRRSALKPPVVIESMLSDGVTYRGIQDLVAPVAGKDIQINYTSTSLTMPERVQFQYRLDGLDSDWREAGSRRQAFYTNLKHGSYRFRVKAVNGDGVWSQDTAELAFKVPPAFYETIWFRSLAVLMLAAIIVTLYRFRLRQVAARVRLSMEARHQERERIARELHDTILQGTQGLVLSFQALAGQLQTNDKVRLSMESLLDQAELAIESARKSVSNLRDFDTNPTSLVEMFEALMDELSDAPIPVRLSVHGTEPTLNNDLPEQIFRIGREAVLNALRHSQANRVDVALRFEGQYLRMIVSDDGVGIRDLARASAGRSGHWGLVGMRERAATIDAQLLIQSAAGSGTTVELSTKRSHGPLRHFIAVLRNSGRRRHGL